MQDDLSLNRSLGLSPFLPSLGVMFIDITVYFVCTELMTARLQ